MDSTDDNALDEEMGAMVATRKVLSALEPAAQRRVLLWLGDMFSVNLSGTGVRSAVATPGIVPVDQAEVSRKANPASFAELLERFEPTNNADRVLAAAFWLQEIEGQESLDGRSINKLLKEHGIDVSNVTNAFTALINRRPRLAIQAGKKGKFEKLYRLTTEGRRHARELLSQQE